MQEEHAAVRVGVPDPPDETWDRERDRLTHVRTLVGRAHDIITRTGDLGWGG